MADRKYRGIISAIRNGRLNCDKHADDTTFLWFGRKLRIRPFFVSYGQGGYEIRDEELDTTLTWDFDCMPRFEVNDYNGNCIYKEDKF